ncbi:MAG: Mini-ribonuclease 3 [Lachnospiraceae bacterium]
MNDLIAIMGEKLGLKEVDLKTYSPLTLAYIGDGVFDLIIRSYVVNKGNKPVNKYHRETSSIVKAQSQAVMIAKIEPLLSEEEMAVYKRGRNAKSHTSAKNASIGDYRKATGFEALVGYLYLDGQYDRLMELMKVALVEIGEMK